MYVVILNTLRNNGWRCMPHFELLTQPSCFVVPRGDRSAQLVKLRDDLQMARNQTGVPGMSVAIFHKGKLIFAEGFEKRNKMDPSRQR